MTCSEAVFRKGAKMQKSKSKIHFASLREKFGEKTKKLHVCYAVSLMHDPSIFSTFNVHQISHVRFTGNALRVDFALAPRKFK